MKEVTIEHPLAPIKNKSKVNQDQMLNKLDAMESKKTVEMPQMMWQRVASYKKYQTLPDHLLL